jgi:hypothetical protein
LYLDAKLEPLLKESGPRERFGIRMKLRGRARGVVDGERVAVLHLHAAEPHGRGRLGDLWAVGHDAIAVEPLFATSVVAACVFPWRHVFSLSVSSPPVAASF